MKALYIIALIVTVLFGVVDLYYINQYQDAYISFLFSDIYSNDYSFYDDSYYILRDISSEASLISLIFLSFYVFLFSFTIAKIKRLTAKVMGIIGVSISGLIFLINLIPVLDPGGISWDEFGPLIFLYVLAMLGFCIVNLIQAIRNEKPQPNQMLVDDIN